MMTRLPRWLAPPRPILLLLAARLAVGLLYSASLPPWEADNEDSHFAYARYIAVRHTLPQPNDPEAEGIWEKFQPPLYYALLAPALLPFNLGESFQAPERYPFAAFGNAGANYNVQTRLLTHAAQQTVLALYVARGLSVLLSTLSVVFVYLAARRLWASRVAAYAATIIYAFWPQFLFTGSVVTNDVLITALAALCFYLTVQIIIEGARWRWVIALSLSLGAALLTKLNGAALIPAAGLALLVSQRPTRRFTVRLFASVLLALVAVAGGLAYVSTLDFVTGQVFSAELLKDFWEVAPNFATVTTQSGANLTLWTLSYGFRTFVASYGWGNLEAYGWLYPAWAVAALLAGAGIITTLQRKAWHWPKRTLLVLVILSLSPLALALGLALTQHTLHVPGRYYLPALPAMACLLTLGWETVFSLRWRKRALQLVSLGVVLSGALIPLDILLPTYAIPLPLTTPPPNPVSIHFGETIKLIGYEARLLIPGQHTSLTLCWQATAPVEENYSVLVEVVGSDGQGYGRLLTYPGRGNYATTLWEPGRAFCDEYRTSVGADIPAPSTAELHIALLTTPDVNGPRLPIRASNEAHATFPVKVAAGPRAQPPSLAHTADVRFSDVFRLRGYEIHFAPDDRQQRVTVTLLWEAMQTPSANYTLFAHLRDTPLTNYAQADSQPQAGRYPTSLWAAGETVRDAHIFTLSSHEPPLLDLYLGWVDAEGNRLPAFDAEGQPLLNDEAIIARGLAFHFPTPIHYTDWLYLPFIQLAEPAAPASAPYP